MMQAGKKNSIKVPVKPNNYYPTKAEIEEDIHIPTTPEHLAKCMQGVQLVPEKSNIERREQ